MHQLNKNTTKYRKREKYVIFIDQRYGVPNGFDVCDLLERALYQKTTVL